MNIDWKTMYAAWSNMDWIKRIEKPFDRGCLHEACDKCHGTGVDERGTICVHGISCPCPKCSFIG